MKIEAGQVAVVTGGTSGIGFALADRLVQRGVDVMIADIREDAIPIAVDALSGQSGRVAGVRADVRIDADLDAVADATMESFGRVDLVCNNAGVVCEQSPMAANSAALVPPGAATTAGGVMPDGAMKPATVAQAALEAVEAGRVHAVVGEGADVVARQRVDALLADLVQVTAAPRCRRL